jgi:translation initiation factor 5
VRQASKNSKKKSVAGADAITGQPGQDDDNDDDELTKQINAGAAALLSEEAAAKLIAEHEADQDWGEDTSPEAVAKRMAALGVTDSLLQDGEENDTGDKYTAFADEVKENLGEWSNAEIYKRSEDVGKAYKVLAALVPALFTEKVVEELPTRLPLLAKVRPPSFLRRPSSSSLLTDNVENR